METTHAMTAELLGWAKKMRVLWPEELAFVESVARTMAPSMPEHDLICVLHTRAETNKKRPARPAKRRDGTRPPTGFQALAADVGIAI